MFFNKARAKIILCAVARRVLEARLKKILVWLIFWPDRSIPNAARKEIIFEEFDPGSGLTLAACLTYASRATLRGSGGRVSNMQELDSI